MIYLIIIGLVIAYLSIRYLFKPAAGTGVAATAEVPASKSAVILSPAAQIFLQKYGFQNNYRNDNAITICLPLDFFSLSDNSTAGSSGSGCSDLWINKLKVMCEVCKVFLLIHCNNNNNSSADTVSSNSGSNSSAETEFRARLAQSGMATLVPPHVSGNVSRYCVLIN